MSSLARKTLPFPELKNRREAAFDVDGVAGSGATASIPNALAREFGYAWQGHRIVLRDDDVVQTDLSRLDAFLLR